jgi:hypothetical protein
MGELVAFDRVAATAKTDGTSALASTWRVMMLTSEPLEQWYYALLEREVPRAPAALPPRSSASSSAAQRAVGRQCRGSPGGPNRRASDDNGDVPEVTRFGQGTGQGLHNSRPQEAVHAHWHAQAMAWTWRGVPLALLPKIQAVQVLGNEGAKFSREPLQDQLSDPQPRQLPVYLEQ